MSSSSTLADLATASSLLAANQTTTTTSWTVGFGTAALGDRGFDAVTWALQEGFRAFDTAEEHEYWYDSETVGHAASKYFQELLQQQQEEGGDTATAAECDESLDPTCPNRKARALTMYELCHTEKLQMSTKIPPWSLTSHNDIRDHAKHSRKQLVGFCDDIDDALSSGAAARYPLDIYYIHAPSCWQGWHPRCDNPPPLLSLRDAWVAMEAVAGEDHSAVRIGLSNVRVDELLDIIEFVQERQQQQEPTNTNLRSPPRIPDVIQSYADPIEPADDIREVCAQHNITFVSYSTLGTQHKYRRSKSGSGELENPVLTSPVIVGIAKKHQRSVAEVVLSWALIKGMSVIPRSTNRRHIQELARLFADPHFLDDDDVQAIDDMKHTI